jgi:dTDP-4-amino-4,6-dideoxygalactose transaminase
VVRDEFLPFSLPTIGDEEIAEVADSLRSGWVTTGPKTQRFEEQFAEYVGCRHAIATHSCTGGMHVALAALGIGPGDEVIIPAMTFCSTANVVAHVGARPVLVDVGEDFLISPAAAEAAINAKTKVIMPVHYGGQPCDLGAIYALAAKHDLAVIEDAAHAVGAEYRGLKLGSEELPNAVSSWQSAPDSDPEQGTRFAHAVVFSFYANKNMTTGEGGMIVVNDNAFAETMRPLTLHGMSRDAWKRHSDIGSWYYEVVALGYKYNMSDLQAAIGIHQLKKLELFIEARRRLARLYDEAFSEIPEVLPPVVHKDRRHVFHLYAARIAADQMTIDRSQFMTELKARKIGGSVHFIPIHLHPYYQEQFEYRRGDYPQAEKLYEQEISLPLFPRMTDEDVVDVVDAVMEIVSTHRL